jgi:L-threonylcarbamoyladenylate synthase
VTEEEVHAFERCIEGGGVALFPSDTVYGLATHPQSAEGRRKLYALKGRDGTVPAAVMFFALDQALEALPELGPRTRTALQVLLPGALTLLVPNPARRYSLASGSDPERLGVRVPRLMGSLAPLESARLPVVQSSANRSGGKEARRIEDVDERIRLGTDLELDGGELPGVASTVVDLTRFEAAGEHTVVREGALAAELVAAELSGIA